MSTYYTRVTPVIPLLPATPRTMRVGEVVQKNGALATANDNAFAVTVFAQNNPTVPEMSVAVIGAIGGTVSLIADETIEFGDKLSVTADGKVEIATTEYNAVCVEPDGALENQLFEAVIHPPVAIAS